MSDVSAETAGDTLRQPALSPAAADGGDRPGDGEGLSIMSPRSADTAMLE